MLVKLLAKHNSKLKNNLTLRYKYLNLKIIRFISCDSVSNKKQLSIILLQLFQALPNCGIKSVQICIQKAWILRVSRIRLSHPFHLLWWHPYWCVFLKNLNFQPICFATLFGNTITEFKFATMFFIFSGYYVTKVCKNS